MHRFWTRRDRTTLLHNYGIERRDEGRVRGFFVPNGAKAFADDISMIGIYGSATISMKWRVIGVIKYVLQETRLKRVDNLRADTSEGPGKDNKCVIGTSAICV